MPCMSASLKSMPPRKPVRTARSCQPGTTASAATMTSELISATASKEPVITTEQMRAAIRSRKRRPIFAVDIAMPRDLEAGIGDLNDIYLYTIDDLDKVIMEGHSDREAAAVDANRILDDETQRYLSIERSKEVAPLITALRDHGDALRNEVLEQARRRLAKGVDQDEVLQFVTSSLLKKLLHQPSVKLRDAYRSIVWPSSQPPVTR